MVRTLPPPSIPPAELPGSLALAAEQLILQLSHGSLGALGIVGIVVVVLIFAFIRADPVVGRLRRLGLRRSVVPTANRPRCRWLQPQTGGGCG